MKAIRCAIVEDEVPNRDILTHLLNESSVEVEIVGSWETLNQANGPLQAAEPDLIFMDIRMPGTLGIRAKEVMPDLKAPIVFTTAFEEYAVEAFTVGALDYLLKPLGQKEVDRSLERYLLRYRKERPQKESNSFVVSTTETVDVYDREDILAFEADGNYTILHLKDGSTSMISKNLGSIMKSLDGGYIRIHAKYAVRKAEVVQVTREKPYVVVLSNGVEYPTSVRKRALVIKALKG
ncbi:LytR/AlgR family response regulator transcription factor [Sanyastnella coralliicola]|uniref:LytR/AlgR family response regulator transcription factor n=1 Tax=Sanyastnella coralliicola TaxID=3069118 RepID=UPI0027BAA616|nr:LytTR family DNA-binding domain-containing protein [Longitalea sp. SCSIO 12813]